MVVKDKRDPYTHAIIGAAMEVHRELGCGFLETVYQEALALEMAERDILFEREVALPVFYKGHRLDTSYRPDFICFEKIIVELKAISKLTGVEEPQIINYLKATGSECGLLLNFGLTSLEYKKFIYTNGKRRMKDYRGKL